MCVECAFLTALEIPRIKDNIYKMELDFEIYEEKNRYMREIINASVGTLLHQRVLLHAAALATWNPLWF